MLPRPNELDDNLLRESLELLENGGLDNSNSNRDAVIAISDRKKSTSYTSLFKTIVESFGWKRWPLPQLPMVNCKWNTDCWQLIRLFALRMCHTERMEHTHTQGDDMNIEEKGSVEQIQLQYIGRSENHRDTQCHLPATMYFSSLRTLTSSGGDGTTCKRCKRTRELKTKALQIVESSSGQLRNC